MQLDERLQEMLHEGKQKPQTIWNYQKLLHRIGVTDDSLDRYELESRLYGLDNLNVKRSTIIALRAVWGVKFPIPEATRRTYELPDEETIRFVLMQSRHETRFLAMMYCGLRVGEAGALTGRQLRPNNRLMVDRQLIELNIADDLIGGKRRIVRIGPPKTGNAEVVVPSWLVPRIESLEETVHPNGLQKSARYFSRRSGIKINPHMLRHWLATDLISKGVPLALVQKQLRHRNLETTLQVYQQYRDSILGGIYD